MDDLKKLDNYFKKLSKSFNKKKMAKDIGKKTADIVKKRIKEGYGVNRNDGEKGRLKPLSSEYIEVRKKKKSKLSGDTSPTKSNLHFTGKTIDSIDYNLKGDSIVIESQKGAENLAHNEKTRPVMFLAEEELDNIEKQVDDYIDDLILKAFE